MKTIKNVLPADELLEKLSEAFPDHTFSLEDVPWSCGDLAHALVSAKDFIDWAVGLPPDFDDPFAKKLIELVGCAEFIDLERQPAQTEAPSDIDVLKAKVWDRLRAAYPTAIEASVEYESGTPIEAWHVYLRETHSTSRWANGPDTWPELLDDYTADLLRLLVGACAESVDSSVEEEHDGYYGDALVFLNKDDSVLEVNVSHRATQLIVTDYHKDF